MKNTHETKEATVEVGVEEVKVHPLHKSYMFISSKHVDYNNLNAIEAVTLSLALVLSVTIGVLSTIVTV